VDGYQTLPEHNRVQGSTELIAPALAHQALTDLDDEAPHWPGALVFLGFREQPLAHTLRAHIALAVAM
jgi:hypothetical protein